MSIKEQEPQPFVVFDVDGTIFKSSLLEKAIDKFIEEGIVNSEPFNDVYTSRRRWQQNNTEGGYNAYLRMMVEVFVQQISGIDEGRAKEAIQLMVEEQSVRLHAFPRRLKELLEHTHHSIAISGSPQFLVDPFLGSMQFDAQFGSSYEVEDGKFTGVAQSVGKKAVILDGLVSREKLSLNGSVAVGDTMGDEDLLQFVAGSGVPILFNASKTLTDYAKVFGWVRVIEKKDDVTIMLPDSDGRYGEVNEIDLLRMIQKARCTE